MTEWKIPTFEEAAKEGLVPKSYSKLFDLQKAADYLGLALITVQIQAKNGMLKTCRIRHDAKPLFTTQKWCDEYRKEHPHPGLKKGQKINRPSKKGRSDD